MSHLWDYVKFCHGSKEPQNFQRCFVRLQDKLDSSFESTLSPRVKCICKQQQRMRIAMGQIKMADGLPLAIVDESNALFPGKVIAFRLISLFVEMML